MSDYRTFLVPYDFSEHAEAALATALDLAGRLDAAVHLLHVIEPPVFTYPAFEAAPIAPPSMLDVRAAAQKSLEDVASARGQRARLETHVVEGASIAEMIGESADELGADLIVMGTHGRTGLAHVFLGSVAERTLRRAPCPVLTVRASEEDAS
jgi:nucleotide-binding universal stress UspA family protein